jgi:hypothetical protein
VNQYDEHLEHLNKKLEDFKNLESQTNSAVDTYSKTILPPQPRDILQNIVQKVKDKIGSYAVSDDNQLKKLQICQDEIGKMCKLWTESKEYAEQKPPKFAYSGIRKDEDELSTAYLAIQTKQNEIEVVKIYLTKSELEILASHTGGNPNQQSAQLAYHLTNVVFEGYSTRETNIIGFDFVFSNLIDKQAPIEQAHLLVATADGSISQVDLIQSNTIKGLDTFSTIKFDVDLARKIPFPIKKDFSRMEYTTLEAVMKDAQNQAGKDGKEQDNVLLRFQYTEKNQKNTQTIEFDFKTQ